MRGFIRIIMFWRLYKSGNLGEDGKSKQHTYGCKHAAVNHSYRWADEAACNAVISTFFSVSYLVLEFQTSGTKVSHNCDCP